MSWQVALGLYGVVLVALLVFGVGIGSVMGLVGILGVTAASGWDCSTKRREVFSGDSDSSSWRQWGST